MVLYVVGTPIGNMEDMTYRGVRVLNESDIILCEDTRLSLRLLNHYGIKKRLISYHKFNERKILEDIIKGIKSGIKYSLISDAGMPAISDPGRILINECIKEGIKIDVIGGPCALINGKILSGFDKDIFTFIGFLPRGSKELNNTLYLMKSIHTLLIIYESPHRIIETLYTLKDNFGDRDIYIGRELTKMFEENFRGSISESIEHFESKGVKGEFLIILDNIKEEIVLKDSDIIKEYNKNKDKGFYDKENIKDICKRYNLKRNYVYDLILKYKNLT